MMCGVSWSCSLGFMLKLYVSCHLTMKDMVILLTCVPSLFNCVKVVYSLAPYVGCDLLWYFVCIVALFDNS